MISLDLKEAEQKIEALEQMAAFGVEVGWPEGTPQAVLERAWNLEYRWQGGGPPHWYINPVAPMRDYENWAILHRLRILMESQDPNYAVSSVVSQLANQGLFGQALWTAVGEYYRDVLKELLMSVTTPELAEYTKQMKRLEGAPMPEKPLYEWGDLYSAISYRVVPKG